MRAEIKNIFSTDADVETWTPADASAAGLIVLFDAGAAGEHGGDQFQVMVVTPSWLAAECHQQGPVIGRHHLIVEKWDWPIIKSFLTSAVESIEGDSWRELADRISRIAYWEFEDYRRTQTTQ